MPRATLAQLGTDEDPGRRQIAPEPVRGEESVVGDYSVVTVAGVVSALLSFGSATLTTRLLAPAAFGALSMVFVTSLILQTATSAWTALAVARFGREALELTGDMRTVTRARVRLVLPWLVAATVTVFALKGASFLPRQLTLPLVAVAVLHGAVATAYEHCMNLLRSWGRQRLSAATVLAQQLILVAVVAVLLARGARVTALEIALLYAAGSVALLLIYVPLLWRVGLAPVARDHELELRMRRFSHPLILFTVSSYVIGSVDLWILGAYAAPAAVGRYAAVYRAFTTLMGVAAVASPVLTTLFVSMRLAGRGEEMARFVERVAPTLVTSAGVVTAVATIPAYVLVPVVFGHPFAAAALPLAILLVGVVAYLECCLLGTVLTAHDRTAETARAITWAAVLNILGDFLAIGVLGAGIWAPAVATSGAFILMAFGYSRAAGRCTGTSPRVTWLAYLAPVASVVTLAAAPSPARLIAATGVALLLAAASVTAARLRGDFDPGLLLRRRSTAAGHAYTAGRG